MPDYASHHSPKDAAEERPMTISSPTRETTPLPRARLGLTWLLTRAGRLRAAWSRVYGRGQLGPAPGEVRHDRYLAPHDRVTIPRIS